MFTRRAFATRAVGRRRGRERAGEVRTCRKVGGRIEALGYLDDATSVNFRWGFSERGTYGVPVSFGRVVAEPGCFRGRSVVHGRLAHPTVSTLSLNRLTMAYRVM